MDTGYVYIHIGYTRLSVDVKLDLSHEGKNMLVACGNRMLRKMFVPKLDGITGDCIVRGCKI
jgi:hypothetical protein